jgi:hypothetical protein
MPFDYNVENVYHFAIVVPEIERGMEEIAKQFNVTFPPPLPVHVTGIAQGHQVELATRFVYSREGPPFIEVVQAIQGTVLDAPGGASRVHHFGIFVDDVETEVARLQKAGFDLEFQAIATDGGRATMAFINSSLGIRQELVSAEFRGSIDQLTNR